MATDQEREEWQALLDADTLHMLPVEAHIASVRHLAGRLLELTEPAATVPYARAALVEVLVYHWATSTSGCGCGWAELGHSHAEHVADVYEVAAGWTRD